MTSYLLVNFGGPRSLEEIPDFLTALLQDRDVIRTRLPTVLHNWFFGYVARKRALKIRKDYELIGGKSPIYFDTEKLAKELSTALEAPVLTFHRYLPETHAQALQKIDELNTKEIRVLPLFPQFCYATTGSIARFFAEKLKQATVNRFHWIKSYAGHPAFIAAYQKRIRKFLEEHNLYLEETALLFSAHGLPQNFINEGDIYEYECNLSYREILKGLPGAVAKLSYQSKFGRGEWIRPYTNEICEEAASWGRKNVVIVPLSFTSDHIETLYEIEHQYLPPIQAQGLNAYRCPAFSLEKYWIEALLTIVRETNVCSNDMLIR